MSASDLTIEPSDFARERAMLEKTWGQKPGLLGWLGTGAAANASGCVNRRQFMVFLQKDDHAIG